MVAERIIDEDTGEEVVRYKKVSVKKLEGDIGGDDREESVRRPLIAKRLGRKASSSRSRSAEGQAIYQTFGVAEQ